MLPPIRDTLNERGDRVIRKLPDPYTGRVRVSGTVKLTPAEQGYVAWLRAREARSSAGA
jgi:hypothetical protein